MNKKLVLGIVVGVFALLAVVIAIFSITGTFGKTDKDDNDSTPSSSVISSGDSSENASSEDKKPNTEVTVEAKKAKKNSIISIPVKINDNPGFCAGTFVFKYDTELLTYVDYEDGEIHTEHEVAVKDNKISSLVYSSDNKDVNKNGTVITLNFKVKKPSSDNKYKITIDGEGTMLGNYEAKEVFADISLGEATVKK
ncbi:MAG: hypothetical protein E7561_00510 [Ruminococcaceae bacterium]|nr:hypothetical protein [Oscillospiraceae bacterium]